MSTPALLGCEMQTSHYPPSFPNEGFGVHTEPWQAMLQNTPLEDILTSPATRYSSVAGYMNIVCVVKHLPGALQVPF